MFSAPFTVPPASSDPRSQARLTVKMRRRGASETCLISVRWCALAQGHRPTPSEKGGGASSPPQRGAGPGHKTPFRSATQVNRSSPCVVQNPTPDAGEGGPESSTCPRAIGQQDCPFARGQVVTNTIRNGVDSCDSLTGEIAQDGSLRPCPRAGRFRTGPYPRVLSFDPSSSPKTRAHGLRPLSRDVIIIVRSCSISLSSRSRSSRYARITLTSSRRSTGIAPWRNARSR